MKVFHHPQELRDVLRKFHRQKRSIGFVPTMGYLHQGHLSLVKRANEENAASVVSIFVNPLQFGPREDFWRYPRDLSRDKELLKREKVDFLFVPRQREFYAEDFQTSISVNKLSQPLCGASRPIHFAGVATVVLKLLNIIGPDVVYLGQKDYQQFRVVEQMVKDLSFPSQVRLMPIVREPDGLAMSSRNIFLSPLERREALFLYRSLEKARGLIRSGLQDVFRLKKAIRETLKCAPHARVDYIEIVDAQTLRPVVKLKNYPKVLIALAVYFGKTRLIDNHLVDL